VAKKGPLLTVPSAKEESELSTTWQLCVENPISHVLVEEGQDEVIRAELPNPDLMLLALKEMVEV
jgi:hypothetical protein